MEICVPATELDVSEWIGPPTSLAELRGRVVLVEAFQMLCPGCVTGGLPQAQRVRRALPDVVVLGLHTVFEHLAAQGPVSLTAFLSEYRITFPVGIDRNDGGYLPVTMRAYELQGTPSTLLIDRAGNLRVSHFGSMSDVALGAHLGMLLAEPPPIERPRTAPPATAPPPAEPPPAEPPPAEPPPTMTPPTMTPVRIREQ